MDLAKSRACRGLTTAICNPAYLKGYYYYAGRSFEPGAPTHPLTGTGADAIVEPVKHEETCVHP
jgi:hypothetical protein